jgi:hypothetical protein
MKDILLGLVRHLLTSAGGALVAKGVVTTTTLDQGVGLALVAVGALWSLIDKKLKAAVPEIAAIDDLISSTKK